MSVPGLKPCPFCGGSLAVRHAGWFDHPIGKCVLSGRAFHKGFIGQWNTRTEDPETLTALRAEIARLTEALEFGVDLIRDDAVGSEWKNGCAKFIKHALAALRRGGAA